MCVSKTGSEMELISHFTWGWMWGHLMAFISSGFQNYPPILFLFREIFPMTTNRNSKALVFSQLCWSCVNFSVCFHELFLGCPSSRAQYQVRWRGWQPSCRDETTSKKWTAHRRDSCTRGHRWRRWVAGRCYKCWGPIDMETGPASVWRMTWL